MASRRRRSWPTTSSRFLASGGRHRSRRRFPSSPRGRSSSASRRRFAGLATWWSAWRPRCGRSTRSHSFAEGALLAVNLGDDADTTGAVYGQLAGAYYGEQNIPDRWVARVAHRELVVGFADRLFELAEALPVDEDVTSGRMDNSSATT